MAPEVFETKYPDGSHFKVSDSYCRLFLRSTMEWSERKATRAAQHLPKNWEDVCERAALRRAYVIKKEDIPAELIVNSDQTGIVYNPGAKLTWAPRGSSQVSVIGADEKRAFTALLAMSLSGTLLATQCVYVGATDVSCPSLNAPKYAECAAANFRHVPSKSGNHWSNLGTMKDFVIYILDPYFAEEKQRLGLPPDQKSLWILDVWSVQRSKAWRDWMRINYPNIILDFIPGGCTGVSQPLDVGINRPFKAAYHAHVVETLVAQMDRGEEVHFDTHIGPLRDASVAWLWAGYQVINNPVLVKKVRLNLYKGYHSHERQAFALCKVREWDLSYETLTSPQIRARLRKEEAEETEFWRELQENKADKYLPPEGKEVTEDVVDEEEGPDDSDISPAAVVADVTASKRRRGRVARKSDGSGLRSMALADDFEMVLEPVASEATGSAEETKEGRPKRAKKPNQHYLGPGWLYHDDEDDSDVEPEE